LGTSKKTLFYFSFSIFPQNRSPIKFFEKNHNKKYRGKYKKNILINKLKINIAKKLFAYLQQSLRGFSSIN